MIMKNFSQMSQNTHEHWHITLWITVEYSLFYTQSVVRLVMGTTIAWVENLKLFAAWKVSIFGVFLVGIFPYLAWEWGDTRTKKIPNRDSFDAVLSYTEAHSEPRPWTIITKSSILDVWQGFEYHSATRLILINSIKTINNNI